MRRGLFFASVVFAFALAWIAQRSGSAIIIGSFAAGLVLARTDRGREIEHEVHDVAQFFVPIFFVVVGAAVDLESVSPFTASGLRYFLIGLALTAIGIAGKVAAGFVVRRKGMNKLVIGVGMIPRGEVGLIFAQIGLATKLLSTGLYSAVALMVMLTTFIAPPLLRRLLVPRTPDERDAYDLVVDAPEDRDEEEDRDDRSIGSAEGSSTGQPPRSDGIRIERGEPR
jgi:Kef-type K+ transport system membrane component KefB